MYFIQYNGGEVHGFGVAMIPGFIFKIYRC